MNIAPLFATARVLRAAYRIISTTILIYYLVTKRPQQKRIRQKFERDDDY